MQQQAKDSSVPHDDLTACLRMCGMSLKDIQAMHSDRDKNSIEISAEDSMLKSTCYKRMLSMSSTNAGTHPLTRSVVQIVSHEHEF